jgi:hypothetical protein
MTDLSRERHAGRVVAIYENGDKVVYNDFLLIGVRDDGHGGEATVSIHNDNSANRIIKYGNELMDALRKELARN